MKNNITVFFLLLCLLSCVNIDENKKYIISDFEYYTGIHENYKIDSLKFGANQAYLEVNISTQNFKQLRNKYCFVSADSVKKIEKNSKRSFISFRLADIDNLKDDHEYHFIYNDSNDGYFFIGLSKDSSKLFTCENFPELPPGI